MYHKSVFCFLFLIIFLRVKSQRVASWGATQHTGNSGFGSWGFNGGGNVFGTNQNTNTGNWGANAPNSVSGLDNVYSVSSNGGGNNWDSNDFNNANSYNSVPTKPPKSVGNNWEYNSGNNNPSSSWNSWGKQSNGNWQTGTTIKPKENKVSSIINSPISNNWDSNTPGYEDVYSTWEQNIGKTPKPVSGSVNTINSGNWQSNSYDTNGNNVVSSSDYEDNSGYSSWNSGKDNKVTSGQTNNAGKWDSNKQNPKNNKNTGNNNWNSNNNKVTGGNSNSNTITSADYEDNNIYPNSGQSSNTGKWDSNKQNSKNSKNTGSSWGSNNNKKTGGNSGSNSIVSTDYEDSSIYSSGQNNNVGKWDSNKQNSKNSKNTGSSWGSNNNKKTGGNSGSNSIVSTDYEDSSIYSSGQNNNVGKWNSNKQNSKNNKNAGNNNWSSSNNKKPSGSSGSNSITSTDYEDNSANSSWGSGKENKPTSGQNKKDSNKQNSKNSGSSSWGSSNNKKPGKGSTSSSSNPSESENALNPIAVNQGSNNQNQKSSSAIDTSILDELDKNDWYFGSEVNYPNPPFKTNLNIDVSELWNFDKSRSTSGGNNEKRRRNRAVFGIGQQGERAKCACVNVNLCDERDMIVTKEDAGNDFRTFDYTCSNPIEVCCTNPKGYLNEGNDNLEKDFQEVKAFLNCGQRRTSADYYMDDAYGN